MISAVASNVSFLCTPTTCAVGLQSVEAQGHRTVSRWNLAPSLAGKHNTSGEYARHLDEHRGVCDRNVAK